MKNINKKTPDTEVLSRLLWQSRRGMLELDLMLEPFVTEVYFSLSEDINLGMTGVYKFAHSRLIVIKNK